MRLEIRRITSIKQGEQLVGNRTRIKVAKNKMAPPFGTTEVDIMFNQGISYYGAIVDTASQAGIIKKSGSWFAYQDQKIGQGRENVKQFLNPALALEIENAIYDFYQLPHLKKKLAQKTTAKKDTSSFSNSPDVIDSENPNTEANAKAKAKEVEAVEAGEAGDAVESDQSNAAPIKTNSEN